MPFSFVPVEKKHTVSYQLCPSVFLSDVFPFSYRVVGMVFCRMNDALRIVKEESAEEDQTPVNAIKRGEISFG